MKRKLILHAGNLKTGSSAIQHYLNLNQRNYAEQHDLAIPGIERRVSAHTSLAEAATPARVAAKKIYTWDEFRAEAARAPQSRILLSSENFIQSRACDLKSLLDTITDTEPGFFFYLRPHIGMATSQYAQLVKAGVQMAGPQAGVTAMWGSGAIDFVAAIDRFAEVFGPQAIQCREYARQHFKDGDVLNDFSDFFGLPDLAQPLRLTKVLVNPTPGAEALALIHAFVLSLKDGTTRNPPMTLRDLCTFLREALTRLVPPDLATRYRLPLPVQALLKQRFEAGRIAFLDRFALPKVSDDWRDEPLCAPEPPNPLPWDIVEMIVQTVARRLEETANPLAPAFLAAARDVPTVVLRGQTCLDVAALPLFHEGQGALPSGKTGAQQGLARARQVNPAPGSDTLA